MKNLLLSLILSIIFASCLSEEQKNAEKITDNFMERYIIYSKTNQQNDSITQDILERANSNMHTLFTPNHLWNNTLAIANIDSFEKINTIINDSSIIVTYSATETNLQEKRHITFELNKDSLFLNKENTKILKTKGFYDYKKFEYYSYYPDYFDNINDDYDYLKYKKSLMVWLALDIIKNSIYKELTIKEKQVEYVHSQFARGWVNISNDTGIDLHGIPVDFIYYDKNLNTITIKPIKLNETIKKNSRTYCEWYVPNVKSAVKFDIRIDYEKIKIIQMLIRDAAFLEFTNLE